MKKFLKKNWSNILFLLMVGLLIIPQTRTPIQVALNRLIAFGPSEIKEEKREVLEDYNWNLRPLYGETTSFTSAQGKVAIVNFWATWCPPCIAEMPSFQKLYEQYRGRVEFFFVSQEDSAVLEKFLQKKGFDLPIYQPLSIPPKRMQSNSLPITFVLSKKGEIIVEKTGAADWNTAGFHKLLEGLIAE